MIGNEYLERREEYSHSEHLLNTNVAKSQDFQAEWKKSGLYITLVLLNLIYGEKNGDVGLES